MSTTQSVEEQSVTQMKESQSSQSWILSPVADGIFFLFTPLFVIPLILYLTQVWSDKVIYLVVISFFSIKNLVFSDSLEITCVALIVIVLLSS